MRNINLPKIKELMLRAFQKLNRPIEKLRDWAARKLREVDPEAKQNTATVEAIREFSWCWEVLLTYPPSVNTENMETSIIIQMPKDCQPSIGDSISFTARDQALWNGRMIPVDVGRLRIDDDGNVKLG
jgi:hypothetical protein